MTYEDFNRNFPRYSRITVKNWENHENEVFEVVYLDENMLLLQSETNKMGYELNYLEEKLENFAFANLTFDQIKPGRRYLTEYGIVTVLAKSEEDQEVAIQYDDGSLAILEKTRAEIRLNKR